MTLKKKSKCHFFYKNHYVWSKNFSKMLKAELNIDIPIFGIFIYYFKYDVISCKNVENYYYEHTVSSKVRYKNVTIELHLNHSTRMFIYSFQMHKACILSIKDSNASIRI